MLVRYISLFIRVITLSLYPLVYGVKGLYSLTIVGYVYTFLIIPVEIYSQYSVYNNFHLNTFTSKNKFIRNISIWLFMIIILSFITESLFSDQQLIFNKIHLALIFFSAYLMKQNSQGYFKARNLGNNNFANYMQYLATPLSFLLIQTCLFALGLSKGNTYSISTFLSFLIPFIVLNYRYKKIDVSSRFLVKENNFSKGQPIKKNFSAYTSQFIYTIPAICYIAAGKLFGSENSEIFIALFICQKLIDAMAPLFNYFENKYPYKIKYLFYKSTKFTKLLVRKIINYQIKLSFYTFLFSILLLFPSFFILKVIQKEFILIFNYSLYIILIMIITNIFQGNDLILSKINPKSLITVDFFVLILSMLCLYLSISFSYPFFLIMGANLCILFRRFTSAFVIQNNTLF